MINRLIVAALLLVLAGPALALTVQWEPPTTRVDGVALDPATEIQEYTLYCGTAEGGPYDASAYEIPGTATDGAVEATFQELGLPGYGDYFCAMTATDTEGRESAFSEEVALEWPAAAPGAPTSVLIIVE